MDKTTTNRVISGLEFDDQKDLKMIVKVELDPVARNLSFVKRLPDGDRQRVLIVVTIEAQGRYSISKTKVVRDIDEVTARIFIDKVNKLLGGLRMTLRETAQDKNTLIFRPMPIDLPQILYEDRRSLTPVGKEYSQSAVTGVSRIPPPHPHRRLAEDTPGV